MIYHIYTSQKKVRMDILISDKVDFRVKYRIFLLQSEVSLSEG